MVCVVLNSHFSHMMLRVGFFVSVGLVSGDIEDRRLLLFWDYISLHQNRGEDKLRTEIQETSFKAGLAYVNVLYWGVRGNVITRSEKR